MRRIELYEKYTYDTGRRHEDSVGILEIKIIGPYKSDDESFFCKCSVSGAYDGEKNIVGATEMQALELSIRFARHELETLSRLRGWNLELL